MHDASVTVQNNDDECCHANYHVNHSRCMGGLFDYFEGLHVSWGFINNFTLISHVGSLRYTCLQGPV